MKKKEIMIPNMKTANQWGAPLPTNIPTISPSCRPIKLHSSQVFTETTNTKEILTSEMPYLKSFEVEPRKIKARIKFIATQRFPLKLVSSKVSPPPPPLPSIKSLMNICTEKTGNGSAGRALKNGRGSAGSGSVCAHL